MNHALVILFILLVIADTVLTYMVIDSGKGTESGAIAKYYIHNKLVAISLSVILTVVLVGWLLLVNMVWMLIPCILRLGWLCNKHIRILHG